MASTARIRRASRRSASAASDLQAAQFCDAVGRFYASATTGPAAMFMHFMPIGLAMTAPSPPRNRPCSAKPADASAIKSINDTADAATLIRNVLMAQYDQNAAVVLSGPATDLAKLLDMYGVKDWIARKVRLALRGRNRHAGGRRRRAKRCLPSGPRRL
jgi:hypothetical protein